MLTPNLLLPEAWTLVTFQMNKADVEAYVDDAIDEGDLCLKSWGMSRDEMVQHFIDEREAQYVVPVNTSEERLIDLATEMDLGAVIYSLEEPSSNSFFAGVMLFDNENEGWTELSNDEVKLIGKPVDIYPENDEVLRSLEEMFAAG